MAKEKIPVYDICSLGNQHEGNDDFLVDRLPDYLDKHLGHLHFPHRHAFYHLVLFTEGRGTHTIDFSQFDVQEGQFYFMAPGQVHGWNFAGNMNGYIVNFTEALFKPFLQQTGYLERFSFFSGISEEGVCQLPQEVVKTITHIFEQLLQYAADMRRHADMVRVLLLQVFLVVDDALADRQHAGVPQQKLVLLRGFRKLIDTHYRSLRLPKEYADLLYVTPNHLNALCQDLIGKTAGELIRDRVLLEARRLLANARMSVTEVAYDLNFQDNSYFNRFFKKYTGQTPDEFRKHILKA
ncbi:AraC family transcriptional regulator [Chitinophaga horti]|uniref:AraC family transcriptional regulator n=1 Tax=Chitinophaga horti TaxID=2920382 RepID=A0ABY6JAL9_9BACT|nr:helix-turn-helix transcriptional regulator [Chitinophaga horti]UYQ95387.1 AraC family transcriptional regulator [Chitinophaga horti]